VTLLEPSFMLRQGRPPAVVAVECDEKKEGSMGVLCFQSSDIEGSLPAAGYYVGTVATAGWAKSSRGNRMVKIVFVLDDVDTTYERVSDYFVIEGGSERGMAFARTRLVQLYRACGRSPACGDAICPSDLVGALLEVRVEHATWQGRLRLRVIGFRALTARQENGDGEQDANDAAECQVLPGLTHFPRGGRES